MFPPRAANHKLQIIDRLLEEQAILLKLRVFLRGD